MTRRNTLTLLITGCVFVQCNAPASAQTPTFENPLPEEQTICDGAAMSFTVFVDFHGGNAPAIAWEFDDGSGFSPLPHGGRIDIVTDYVVNPASSTVTILTTDATIDAGTYRCLATSGGPFAFLDMDLSFYPAPTVDPIVVFAGTFDGLCLGDTVDLDAQPAGSDLPSQSVVWSIDGGPDENLTQFHPNWLIATPTFNPNASGTYVLRAWIFDCDQTPASATLTVEVFAPLSASPTPSNASTCVSVPVQMAANPFGGNGTYEFQWTVTPNDGSFFSPNATAENPMFRPILLGQYELTVAVSAPASAGAVCATSEPAVAQVTVQSAPVVTAEADPQMCFGVTTDLSTAVTPPDGEYIYSWSIMDGPSTDPTQLSATDIAAPVFTPSTTSAPGVPYRFRVEVSGGNCEVGSDEIDVIVNAPAATAPTATPTVACVGGTTQMAANPSGSDSQSFFWSIVSGPDTSSNQIPNPTLENPQFTPSTLGMYQLKVQLFDAFCDNPADQTVDVEAAPALSVAPTPTDATVCPNTPVPLSANPAGGGGAYTFSWSIVSAPGGGTGEFSTTANPTFIPTLLGTYELEVVVGAPGCEASNAATVTIEVISQVNVTATTTGGITEVCIPNGVGVQADMGGVSVGVTWSILAGSPDTNPNQFNNPAAASTFFRPSAPGEYTLQVEATMTGGDCGDSIDTLIINAYDTFTSVDATATSDAICVGEYTPLQVSTGGSGVDNQFITWSIFSGPDTDPAQLDDVNSDAPTFTPTAATSPGNDYVIRVEVSDPICGPTLSADVVVTVYGALTAAPSADLPGIAACEGVPVDLSANATGGEGTYTYEWSVAIGPSVPPSLFDDPTTAQPVFTPMVGPADYTLDVILGDGVCEPTEPFYTLPLTVEAELAVAPAAEFTEGVLGEPMTLFANQTGGTAPEFTWTVFHLPGNCVDTPLTDADTADPTFTPGCLGTYTMRLAATDPVCANLLVPLDVDVRLFTAEPTADPPLCDSGLNVTAGLSPGLTGGGDFEPFTYLWVILEGSPNTSPAQLQSPTSENPNFTPTDLGVYTIKVTVSNESLPDITAQIEIEVSTDTPVIDSDPVGIAVCAGEPATFTVSTSGTDVSLQWTLNGVDLPGEISATLAIQSVGHGDAGPYACIASNGCGAVTSQPAVLTVDPPLARVPVVGTREDTILREVDTIGCTITGNLLDRGDMGVTTSDGTPLHHVTGLAVHPTTRELYGAVRVANNLQETYLVTIDVVSGAATLVADPGTMGRPIGDLAFHPDGTLYAIRGSSPCSSCSEPDQGQPGEIFTVDLADATLTPLTPPLDFGSAHGHTITFDPEGRLYHYGRVIDVYSRLTRTVLASGEQEILRDFDIGVFFSAMTMHDGEFIAARRPVIADDINELWSLDPDTGYQETVLGPIVPVQTILGLAFACITASDADCDGDVDLDDFNTFQACETELPPLSPQCAALDQDRDGDVDLSDWGAFQVRFTGAP